MEQKEEIGVAWVISPTNAIQCLISHFFFQKHKKKKIKLVVYNYYPTENDDLSREAFEVVRNVFSCIDQTIECHHIRSPNDKVIKEANFIYYAHDVVGNFLDILKQKSPTAKTICYGDSLGLFFEKDIHLGFLSKEKKWKRFVKNIFKKSSENADYAVLTTPIAQSKIRKKTKVLIPDHALATSLFTICAEKFPNVSDYCKQILSISKEKKSFLFLTENMAEGNFISIEREMDLYINTIRESCPPGSFVLVKPHPGEQFDRVSLFQDALGGDYTFQKFSPALKRVPIEFFLPIILEFKVISMFSPALTLKYLYNIDVIQPFTEAAIERYFDKNFWASYKNALNLTMVPLERLNNWDGKSLLYNGK